MIFIKATQTLKDQKVTLIFYFFFNSLKRPHKASAAVWTETHLYDTFTMTDFETLHEL